MDSSKDLKDKRDQRGEGNITTAPWALSHGCQPGKTFPAEPVQFRVPREERLLGMKIPGVCRDGERWRAYLHIGKVQVWQKRGFVTKSEAVDARLDAEDRFRVRKTFIRDYDKANRKLVTTPEEALQFEGLRQLDDGMYQIYRMAPAPADKGEMRFVEQVLGEHEDFGIAALHARAALKGMAFDEEYFTAYLEMHEQAEKLKRDMREFAKETLIPLLQLHKGKGRVRREERSILGYGWQQVRRYKKVPVEQHGTIVGEEKVLSGVYLRLVKIKR